MFTLKNTILVLIYTTCPYSGTFRALLFISLADSRLQNVIQKHTHSVYMKKRKHESICGSKKPYFVQSIKPSAIDTSLYYILYSALSNILIADKTVISETPQTILGLDNFCSVLAALGLQISWSLKIAALDKSQSRQLLFF